MILLICVDDNNGIAFNSRRQSQDRILRQRILELSRGKKLWMSNYSSRQFAEEKADNIVVSDSFASEAGSGDYCFLEDTDYSEALNTAEQIIIFKWNRSYPNDMTFDFDKSKWNLTQTSDFVGYSHEKITEEVYGK